MIISQAIQGPAEIHKLQYVVPASADERIEYARDIATVPRISVSLGIETAIDSGPIGTFYHSSLSLTTDLREVSFWSDLCV